MNPRNTTVPTLSPSAPSPRLSPSTSTLLGNRYILPAITVVLGFLVGIGLMAVVMPKPVDPATYMKPLQAQQVSLKQQQAYARVITIDYPLDVLNFNLMSNDCNNNLVSSCETDASQVASDAVRFQTDLKARTVPACLAHANSLFLAALQDEVQGGTGLDTALKNNDTTQANAAATSLKNGFDGIESAMAAYKAATC